MYKKRSITTEGNAPMTYHQALAIGTRVVFQVCGGALPGRVVAHKDTDGHWAYGILLDKGVYVETGEEWVTAVAV